MLDKKLIDTLVSGGIIATLGATIRALMAGKEPNLQRAKNFIAGVLCGLLITYILRNADWNKLLKEMFIGGCSAFIATYWQPLELFVKWFFSFIIKRWVIKKLDLIEEEKKTKKDVHSDSYD